MAHRRAADRLVGLSSGRNFYHHCNLRHTPRLIWQDGSPPLKAWLEPLWLGGGAIALGLGIWSMHYVGMEALRLPVTVLYDWPTVLVSMIAAVVASGIALFVVSRKTMSAGSTVVASILMGSGISTMHYVGMEAMRLPAMCQYNMKLVVLSVVLAIVISYVALRMTYSVREQSSSFSWGKTSCAVLMGLAIPVMHYVGMAAVTFTPMPMEPDSLKHALNISYVGLAGIGFVTVFVLGFVYISSILDRKLSLHMMELALSSSGTTSNSNASVPRTQSLSNRPRANFWPT